MTNRQTLLCRIAIVDTFIAQLKNAVGKTDIPTKEINLAISDFGISRQKLLDDLAKLDFMKQFAETPWVIKQNPSRPTYYQVKEIVGKVVTLVRKGNSITLGYEEFYRDYVEAKEDEVLQHVKYLTDNGISFLWKPVPCDLTEVPNFDLGSVAPIKAITPAPIKPKNADFFMVTLKQGYGSKVYHETYEIAEAEATRLSKQENKKAYVLGVVAEIEAIPTTTYEVKTKKF